MKKLIIILIAFGIVGCGYKDKNECVLKEQQKCDGGCANEAYLYCNAEFPPTKAEREQANKMFKGLNRPTFNTLKECIDKNALKNARDYCLSEKVVIFDILFKDINN